MHVDGSLQKYGRNVAAVRVLRMRRRQWPITGLVGGRDDRDVRVMGDDRRPPGGRDLRAGK